MFKGRFIVTTLMVLFVFLCAFSIVKMQFEINRLENEKIEIMARNEEISDEIDRLNNSLEKPKDDAYYESKAREKLNLRLPEEVIFYNDLIN